MSENNLESLMRDVARTVQGDVRRRQLLPEIQARLERLDEQSRQAQRSYGTWRLSLLGAAACVFIMKGLPRSAWERFGVWLAIGLVIYLSYGMRHSKLRERAKRGAPRST